MKIRYLATGASEGIPAVFCHCPICRAARRDGGRNIRTRAQAIIDGRLLLDFGPDTFMHSLQYGIDLADVRDCLITHAHPDHLYVEDVMARRRSRANLEPGTPCLNLYGGQGVREALNPDEQGFITKDRSVRFTMLEGCKRVKIGGYTVVPLQAVHSTVSPYVYVIQDAVTSILYGHDTDFLEEETWAFLEREKFRFDLVSLDCTEGKKHIDYPGHMNFERIGMFCKRMRELGLIESNTTVVANHISHNGLVGHDEAVKIGDEMGVVVAYDGLELSIKGALG